MKRIPALVLLAALSFGFLMPATAQIFMGKDSARRAQNAGRKLQKAQGKAAKKAAKKRRKAIKKYQKAQRKGARRA